MRPIFALVLLSLALCNASISWSSESEKSDTINDISNEYLQVNKAKLTTELPDENSVSSDKPDSKKEFLRKIFFPKNQYKTRPIAGFSVAYGLTIVEPSSSVLEVFDGGMGHQVTMETFVRIVDRRFFFAAFNVGVTLHDYSKTRPYDSMSTVIGLQPICATFGTCNDRLAVKLDQILYIRGTVGINLSPTMSLYGGIGIASLYVLPDKMRPHWMLSVGTEWRPIARLGIKIDYSAILNTYNDILFGSPVVHFLNFGFNFYLV